MYTSRSRKHIPHGPTPAVHRVVTYLNLAARTSADYSERHFKLLSGLCVLVPFAYLVDQRAGNPDFDTLAVRMTAFVVAIPLLIFSARDIDKCIPVHLYFVFAVTYILPFTYGVMLSMNAALAPSGKHVELLWILQYFIALFLFIQLIQNGWLASLLWSLSSAAALSPLMWMSDPNWDEIHRMISYPLTGYLTALFFGILTNRNVDYVNAEKLKAASAIGSYIAHELRTPLASIGSLSRAVRKNLKTLCDGYQQSAICGLVENPLPEYKISGLADALDQVESEVNYSNTIIDILLLNTRSNPVYNASPEIVSSSAVVEEALARFPFNNSDEKARVSLSLGHSFSISAPKILLVHVMFNLLKNAVYYMQRSPEGQVSIETGRIGNRNCIQITDTGPGIPSSVRKRVFDRFFTTTEAGQGAGIGLSFCKMVMEGIGGEIQCESKEGEYTTFRLLFPDVS
jgi:two-component system, CAI-1 autoinducer sensor kinase/phosphatase CqsS